VVLGSLGCDSSNAVFIIVGAENTSDKSTVSETIVERVTVGLRIVGSVKGITDEIVSTGNLASLTETSTKWGSGIIDSRIYDTNFDSSSSVSGSVDSIDLDLGVGGETSEW
jgi:hypothetical protein